MTLKVARRGLGGKRWYVLIVVVFVLLAAAYGLWRLTVNPDSSKTKNSTSTNQVESASPVNISSRVLFTGNVYWGRYINDWSQGSPLKTAYPFSRLNEFQRENYQAWIGGLECPTVADVHLTSAQEEATLSFNCSPDYLSEASKWYTAFTLANNHTDNQGAEGFKETQKHLDEHQIQYFGHYDPREVNDICDIIRLPAIIHMDDNTQKEGFLPVALCGYHGVFRIPSEESLEVMRQYSEYLPVIAMPHMGAEYQPAPDSLKTQVYRSMIDHGADVVIGDHPHWVQTTEAYNGKLIVYSMGNFIFDQQFNREVTRSAAIDVTMTATSDQAKELSSWSELAGTCQVYHDDCLAKLKEQKLTKLKVDFGFVAVPSTNAGRLTHPAEGKDAQDVLDRLRWQQTMSGLRGLQHPTKN